ncbi:hypothetical protein M8C21_008498, partial [Ambrosia artemisiifolia]
TLDVNDQAFVGKANCVLSEIPLKIYSHVYDVDTKYHNLSTKDNPLVMVCVDFNSHDNYTLTDIMNTASKKIMVHVAADRLGAMWHTMPHHPDCKK